MITKKILLFIAVFPSFARTDSVAFQPLSACFHQPSLLGNYFFPPKHSPNFPGMPLAKTSAPPPLVTVKEWEAPFLAQGPAGPVWSFGIMNGKLIVAGDFKGADDIHSPCLSEWNGSRWSTLGSGMDKSFEDCRGTNPGDMVIDDNQLYLAYWSKMGGGTPCSGISHWDGSAWECLQGDFNGDDFLSFGVWKGNVLISTITGCYRWDGKAWQILPDIQGRVELIRPAAKGLWLSGNFTVSKDSSIRNLALWNDSSWKGFGIAPDSLADVTEWKGDIFAIQSHYRPNESDSLVMLRYNGNGWSRLDFGMEGSPGYGLASDTSGVFVLRLVAQGWGAGSVLKWDGSHFVEMPGSEFIGAPTSLLMNGDTLFMAGSFRNVSVGADNVVMWDKKSWKNMSSTRSSGPFTTPSLLRAQGTDLYAVGAGVLSAGNIIAHGIAHWNGSQWDALAGGFKMAQNKAWNLKVRDICFNGSDVYVGGRFDSTQGAAVANVAQWDGKSWSSLDGGYPGEVSSLIYDNGGLIVSGFPDGQGSVGAPVLRDQIVGRWNGTTWEKMAGGLLGRADRLTRYRGAIYALGHLKSTADTVYSGMAEWDGVRWQTIKDELGVFSGMDSVLDLTVFHDTVFFIGMTKDNAIDGRAYYLYSWDGARVSRGKGFIDAQALAADNEAMYVSGVFDYSKSGEDVGTLYRYAADGWTPLLTSGDMGTTSGLAISGDYLYATGLPEGINGKPAYNLFRWNRSGNAGLVPPKYSQKGPRSGLVYAPPAWSGVGAGFYGVIDQESFSLIGRKLPFPKQATAHK